MKKKRAKKKHVNLTLSDNVIKWGRQIVDGSPYFQSLSHLISVLIINTSTIETLRRMEEKVPELFSAEGKEAFFKFLEKQNLKD